MPDDAYGLSREEVILAYRAVLLRDPENEDVIEGHRRNWSDVSGFGHALTESEEFRRRFVPPLAPGLPLDLAPNAVEAETTPALLQRLFDAQLHYWERIGESAPHWSALPEPRFQPEFLAPSRRDFDASGARVATDLVATLARHRRAPEGLARVLEQGCGVGRVTRHLVRHFAQVTAADISLAHLRVAAEELGAAGLRNVTFVQATLARMAPLPGCDLWFSHATLQHLPPPLAREVLRAGLEALAPGGLAVFQAVTWIEDYRFATEAHLRSPTGTAMELHALPQSEIFALAEAHGCAPRELREAPGAGDRPQRVLSNLFVLEKRG
jgi:SAM-dependent methyltransferase